MTVYYDELELVLSEQHIDGDGLNHELIQDLLMYSNSNTWRIGTIHISLM